MTREEAINHLKTVAKSAIDSGYDSAVVDAVDMAREALEQESKTGHCKDCKYFEYDSAVKVDGAPLIVAHEICSKWGNGCKTREDGYCFLFEPQAESKEKTCEGCINAKECLMYEPNMKRCKDYKESEDNGQRGGEECS